MAPSPCEIVIISVVASCLPFDARGQPVNDDFAWKFVNYAPIVVTGGRCSPLWIGWHLSAKNWFTGPKTTIDLRGRHRGRRDRDGAPRQDRARRQPHDWKPGDPPPDGTTVSDLEQLLDGIPVLTGQGRHVTPLPGGLTNPTTGCAPTPGSTSSCGSRRPRPGCSASTATPSTSTPWPRPPRGRARRSSTTSRAAASWWSGSSPAAPGPTPTSPPTCPGSPRALRRLHAGPAFVGRFDMFALRRQYLDDRARARLPAAGRATPRSSRRRARRAGARRDRRSRSCRATTTCSPRTSSTTAATCGSSTTSTPATTSRASSSATPIDRGRPGRRRPRRAVRRLLRAARRRAASPGPSSGAGGASTAGPCGG